MEDYLVIGMDKHEHFRAYAAITSKLVQEARTRHNTSPTATAALGRALTAGVLMSANLKGEDLLTLRIIGDGPLGAIVVTTDAEGNVRGYVQNPGADIPSKNGKLDVSGGVGRQGQLSVTKNMGLKEPYTGSIDLVSGEIGEDIAYYYAKSEQIPSVVALGVLVDTDISVKSAGGYLIQAFPGAEEQELVDLEERACSLPNISSLYSEGAAPEQVLQKLLGPDFVELHRKKVGFHCRCSKDKLEQILISLGEIEIRDIIESQERAEIECHFCADKYCFEGSELQSILQAAKDQSHR
ncbi:MAG: Hsp33 family molecular chaperone HslO [Eubacteriales bacterium]